MPALQREALGHGVPPSLADAVAAIESGYTSTAVGSAGEVGLMQILPATAALLGFRGARGELFDPETNIRYAVAYLGRAWAASGGNACRALMKYRAGVGEEAYSPLSIAYCQRAETFLASIGSPLAPGLAAAIPAVSTIADPAGAAGLRPVDFAALAALADMNVRVEQRMLVRADGLYVQPMPARVRTRPMPAQVPAQLQVQAAVDAALAE